MTTPSEDYRLIPLTQGQFAKVDAADYERFIGKKWHAYWEERTKSYYARYNYWESGRTRIVQMHRAVLGLTNGDGFLADHINHDTLDNRSGNLRKATRSQNGMNQRMRSDNSSGFKGVSLHKQSGRWSAMIRINGKSRRLGLFLTPELASVAREAAAAKLFGEFNHAR